MKESDIFHWFEQHQKALTTFDLDKDGQFSYHEIRWAVKTAITWAGRAREDATAMNWLYAVNGAVQGPVSWSELLELHGRCQFAYVKMVRTDYWLPFVLVRQLVEEGCEPDPTGPVTTGPRETPHRAGGVGQTRVDPEQGDAQDPFFSNLLGEIWSDDTFVLENTTMLSGYYSGNLYNSNKKLLLRLKPLPESESGLVKISRVLHHDHHHHGHFHHQHRDRYNRVIATRVDLETPQGMVLYHLNRRFAVGFLPTGAELFSRSNPGLGKLQEATVGYFSIGFDSWGRIDRTGSKVPIRVRGPFMSLQFTIGGTVVAKMISKMPTALDWIVHGRNNYVFKVLDERISPVFIISYLIAARPRFWTLKLDQRF